MAIKYAEHTEYLQYAHSAILARKPAMPKGAITVYKNLMEISKLCQD